MDVETEWDVAMEVDLSPGSPRALVLDGLGLSTDYTMGGQDVESPSLKEAGFATLGLYGVAGDCAEVEVDVPGFKGRSMVLFVDVLSFQGYLRIPVNIASLKKGEQTMGTPIIMGKLYEEIFPDPMNQTFEKVKNFCERLTEESVKVNFFIPLFPLQANSVDPTVYATTVIESVRTVDGDLFTRDGLGNSPLGKRFDFVKTVCADPQACYFRGLTMDPQDYGNDLQALQKILAKSGLGAFTPYLSDHYGE